MLPGDPRNFWLTGGGGGEELVCASVTGIGVGGVERPAGAESLPSAAAAVIAVPAVKVGRWHLPEVDLPLLLAAVEHSEPCMRQVQGLLSTPSTFLEPVGLEQVRRLLDVGHLHLLRLDLCGFEKLRAEVMQLTERLAVALGRGA